LILSNRPGKLTV